MRGGDDVFGGGFFGYGTHDLVEPPGGPRSARFELALLQSEGAPGYEIALSAAQDLERAALASRYLDESAFVGFEATVTAPGAAAGVQAEVSDLALDLDLATGVTYATFVLEFPMTPEDGGRRSVALGVEGFIDVFCRTTMSPGRQAQLDDAASDPTDPPACTALFDAIRAVPDDPDAPPPPWDPNPDDTPDEGGGVIPLLE